MADRRTIRITKEIDGLRNIGPTSNARVKFIIDSISMDSPSQPPSSGRESIINGRLLPNSQIYAQGSIQVNIILGSTFPIQAPKVRLVTKIFHPNVNEKDEVSVDIISPGGWKVPIDLVKVIEEVTGIIDTPSLDMIQNAEAAALYSNNLAEFERVASAQFNSNCAPRN